MKVLVCGGWTDGVHNDPQVAAILGAVAEKFGTTELVVIHDNSSLGMSVLRWAQTRRVVRRLYLGARALHDTEPNLVIAFADASHWAEQARAMGIKAYTVPAP